MAELQLYGSLSPLRFNPVDCQNVVEAAFTGLMSQSSFAIGIGATCMFAHQVAFARSVLDPLAG
jgi:hypothetical protein